MENCFNENYEKESSDTIKSSEKFDSEKNDECGLIGKNEKSENQSENISYQDFTDESTDNELQDKCLFEVNLNDMLRVFMQQNSQFEFLNRFYDNSDSFSNTDSSFCNDFDEKDEEERKDNIHIEYFENELIEFYNIYIWKTNINIIAIAKSRPDAIKQVLERFLITKQQVKNKNKKIFCNMTNDFSSTDGYEKLKKILNESKVFVFPCKKFSCFF